MASPAADALEQFWRCYRSGRFFEAHEVLEEAWRQAHGAEREQMHGLIHGAVARYQHGRGNAEGAARQLARARFRLRGCQLRGAAGFLAEVEAAVAPSLAALDETARARLRRLEEDLSRRESAAGGGRALEA